MIGERQFLPPSLLAVRTNGKNDRAKPRQTQD